MGSTVLEMLNSKSITNIIALLYLGSVAMIFASFLVLRMVFLKTGKLEDLINYSYTYNYTNSALLQSEIYT